jgi:predicted nucleic acid-binding protein
MVSGCELVVASGRLSVVTIETLVIGGAVVVVRRVSVAREISVVGLEGSSVVVETVLVVIVAREVFDTDVDGGRVLPSDAVFVAVCRIVAVMIGEEVVSGIGGEVVVRSVIKS